MFTIGMYDVEEKKHKAVLSHDSQNGTTGWAAASAYTMLHFENIPEEISWRDVAAWVRERFPVDDGCQVSISVMDVGVNGIKSYLPKEQSTNDLAKKKMDKILELAIEGCKSLRSSSIFKAISAFGDKPDPIKAPDKAVVRVNEFFVSEITVSLHIYPNKFLVKSIGENVEKFMTANHIEFSDITGQYEDGHMMLGFERKNMDDVKKMLDYLRWLGFEVEYSNGTLSVEV